MKYFFRLNHWIYSRYTRSFELTEKPTEEEQELMVQIYLVNNDLYDKYWLTWFKLIKDDLFDNE